MRSRLVRRVIMALVIIAIAVSIVPAIHYYKYYMSHVSTDDAYVDGTITLVSSRVAGTIDAVYVDENWQVKAGDLLVTLDPRKFKVKVDHARARLTSARQTVDELFAQLGASQSALTLAQSQLDQAALDYHRAAALRKSSVVSRENYDQARTAYRVAKSNVALARNQVVQARAALGPDDGDSRYDRPIVEQAVANLEQDLLDLSHTRISAPVSGVITHKTGHVGNHIQPGEPLMAIVPTKGLYITANFKETQLTDVRVGQEADVWLDIYPGYMYRGHVDSISMGTGSAFALLPPENATGNWVKVVQRVPVRIMLNGPPPPDKPLRVGLSAEVSIDISKKTGPLLTSELQKHFFRHGKPSIPPEKMYIPPLHELFPGWPDIRTGVPAGNQSGIYSPLGQGQHH